MQLFLSSVKVEALERDLSKCSRWIEMREYAFEIHERVKERKFLKPGKGLLGNKVIGRRSIEEMAS